MDRKQYKTAAAATLKKHYFILMASCFTAVIFSAEFSNMPTTINHYYEHIINYLTSANVSACSLQGAFLQIGGLTPLGLFFLRCYINFLSLIRTFGYGFLPGLISLCSFLIYLFVFLFLFQVISVIIRRMVLEARMYDKVPLQHALFLIRTKKWWKTALSYLTYQIFLLLWSLTIVGGFIKYYSYLMVPYLLAENPDMSGMQALTLSRAMMNGHKKDAFLLDLSMIGWYLLNIVTVGLAGIFYVNPYRTAVFAEYYAQRRKEALAQNIENAQLLNDSCLFAKAEESVLAVTYKSTRMDEMYIKDTEVELTGAKKFFAKGLSIWVGNAKQGKVYQGVEKLKTQLAEDQDALQGRQYPVRLSPLYTRENIHFDGNLTYERSYSISSLILLFLCTSCFIWLYRGGLVIKSQGVIIKTGFLSGPWMPMYGAIALLSLLLLSRLRTKPLWSFLGTVVIAGGVQYLTSYVLEMLYGRTWWNYNAYLFNLNGRTSLQEAVSIAYVCMLVFYLFAPLFDQWLSRRNQKAVLIAALILMALFLCDVVYGYSHPNTSCAQTLFISFHSLL